MTKRATFGPKRRANFIEALSRTGNVSGAARMAGVPRSRVYATRSEDPEFAAAWDEALTVTDDLLEAEAVRRAIQGVESPVYYQGKECGTVRKYSDSLMMFLLKCRRPDKYGDKSPKTDDASGEIVHYEMHFGNRGDSAPDER